MLLDEVSDFEESDFEGEGVYSYHPGGGFSEAELGGSDNDVRDEEEDAMTEDEEDEDAGSRDQQDGEH